MGFFDKLIERGLEKRKKSLEPLAARLTSEKFVWKNGGFFSEDKVIGILAKGALSKGYVGRCRQADFRSLEAKDGLIGNGKNWFPEKE
ncbi:TPA: hypothetical protein HA225_03970 [Candidatus Micrarchaeota archaeon]|nr:hypothetical protein [Candidatus Micrarchaeota archaeon]